MKLKFFLTMTYEQLQSIRHILISLNILLISELFHFTHKQKNKSLSKLFSKINHIDNKYSQSSRNIVWELLKIIKENRKSTTKSRLFSFCSNFWSCSNWSSKYPFLSPIPIIRIPLPIQTKLIIRLVKILFNLVKNKLVF